jgi:uncharacterized protein (TIGR02001 family)
MRNVKILAAFGLMTMAGVAQADVTGTATIVSDYDFRGVSQTLEDPALQISLDYSGGPWYVGVWGSNVDFGSAKPSTEIDVYTGFKGAIEGGLGWDVGLVYYAYPAASDINTAEIYGKLTYSVVTGAVYFTDNYFNTDESEFYVSLDAAIPAGPLSVNLHAGYSDSEAFADGSYTDYGIGVSYSASNLTLGLKWVTQSDYFAADRSDDRVILSVATALPWK